jgi:hypothetical protein
MKSLLSQNWVSPPGMKVWLPTITRPGHHLGHALNTRVDFFINFRQMSGDLVNEHP